MTDLTQLTTPFGLLDDATREALKAHGGPYESYNGRAPCLWYTCPIPSWMNASVYRVKPQPPKPREWWTVGNAMHDSEADAMKFLQLLREKHGALFEHTVITRVLEVLP